MLGGLLIAVSVVLALQTFMVVRPLKRQILFQIRFNEAMTKCYRAEADRGIALLAFAHQQRRQILKLAPNAEMSEPPTSSEALEQAIGELARLAHEMRGAA